MPCSLCLFSVSWTKPIVPYGNESETTTTLGYLLRRKIFVKFVNLFDCYRSFYHFSEQFRYVRYGYQYTKNDSFYNLLFSQMFVNGHFWYLTNNSAGKFKKRTQSFTYMERMIIIVRYIDPNSKDQQLLEIN